MVQDAGWLELISKFHNQFVQQSVSRALIVLVVSNGRGCDAVKSDPAVAFADVVFEGDGGLVSEGDAARNRARVKLNDVASNASLVEPQVFQVLFEAHKLGVLSLPLVNMQSN